MGMKKFFAIISIFALSVFAQEGASSNTQTGPYEPVAREVTQAKNTDSDPLPAPKRPYYNFNSWGIGATVWHNWEDNELNPKRDWDQGVTIHYGRIMEMTTHGAITIMNNSSITYNEHLQWMESLLLGARYFVSDNVFSPFFGGGLGIGLELDYHFDDFDEIFALGPAGGLEVGFVLFRTSTTQLEVGANYNCMLDGFDFDRIFGSFNFYVALNY